MFGFTIRLLTVGILLKHMCTPHPASQSDRISSHQQYTAYSVRSQTTNDRPSKLPSVHFMFGFIVTLVATGLLSRHQCILYLALVQLLSCVTDVAGMNLTRLSGVEQCMFCFGLAILRFRGEDGKPVSCSLWFCVKRQLYEAFMSSSQQTQCPSAADFIFVGERGLELAQPRDYSDYFVSVNQTASDPPPEIGFHSDVSILVDVYLLSGKCASFEVEADASVESLKHRAQSALVTGRGRLLNSSGEALDEAQSVTEAKLMSGDVLTLQVNQVQLKATRQASEWHAFAALLGDRSVVTWGDAGNGGDSSAVQEV